MIKDTSDGETISSTFEYNEKGQLVKIIGKDVYEDETDVYEYIIAYTDGNVEIKGRDGEEYIGCHRRPGSCHTGALCRYR